MLHKPLDALSITALMTASNWPKNIRQAVNAGFAAMCPFGRDLVHARLQNTTLEQQQVIGAALAFSSGVFVCIALGDLLPDPELQFSHARSAQTVVGSDRRRDARLFDRLHRAGARPSARPACATGQLNEQAAISFGRPRPVAGSH